MLVEDDMMPAMLDACPSFVPRWQELLAQWDDEDDLPLYVPLGDLARHLMGLVEREETDELPAVFRVVERWHTEGDERVRDAATVGLLENLQNLNLHDSGTNPEQFRALLGPESQRCWDELAAFWEEFFCWQESQQPQAEKSEGANSGDGC